MDNNYDMSKTVVPEHDVPNFLKQAKIKISHSSNDIRLPAGQERKSLTAGFNIILLCLPRWIEYNNPRTVAVT